MFIVFSHVTLPFKHWIFFSFSSWLPVSCQLFGTSASLANQGITLNRYFLSRNGGDLRAFFNASSFVLLKFVACWKPLFPKDLKQVWKDRVKRDFPDAYDILGVVCYMKAVLRHFYSLPYTVAFIKIRIASAFLVVHKGEEDLGPIEKFVLSYNWECVVLKMHIWRLDLFLLPYRLPVNIYKTSHQRMTNCCRPLPRLLVCITTIQVKPNVLTRHKWLCPPLETRGGISR